MLRDMTPDDAARPHPALRIASSLSPKPPLRFPSVPPQVANAAATSKALKRTTVPKSRPSCAGPERACRRRGLRPPFGRSAPHIPDMLRFARHHPARSLLRETGTLLGDRGPRID